jgi:hypothetical protein
VVTPIVDFLGDPIPGIGYKPWRCSECDAVCNFEAMMQCVHRLEPGLPCGFERDKPESNHGHFGFIEKIKR